MGGHAGAKATVPEPGYERPSLLDSSGLAIRVIGEDGIDFGTFDFSDLAASRELMVVLVAAFGLKAGPGGGWRRRRTLTTATGALRRFVQDLAATHPEVSRIEDLTPEIWWAWRRSVEATYHWPTPVVLMRSLLWGIDGVRPSTRRALAGQAIRHVERSSTAYSREEFRRIEHAAQCIVNTAGERLRMNLDVLARYRAGEEGRDEPTFQVRGRPWTRGALLDHLSRTGRVPSRNRMSAPEAAAAAEQLSMTSPYLHQAIFASTVEVTALMILFACLRGYNPSVLDTMTVDGGRADDQVRDDPVHLVDLDKPRRGPERRFFSNALSGREARLFERAVFLTQPARDTLATLGYPTTTLFVSRIAKSRTDHPSGIFKANWSKGIPPNGEWHRHVEVLGDNGAPLRVQLYRLRLTEQVLNERPRQNTERVSETVYRRPDPQTRAKAARVVLQGQRDALDHARATVRMRTVTRTELLAARHDPTALAQTLGVGADRVRLLVGGRLDTVASACLDFTASPFAAEPGGPCPASFLACLGCENAVATPDQLPRLVALHDALVAISSATTESVWQADYAPHFARLRDLLGHQATEPELAEARASVTSGDVEQIERLLRRRLDR